MTAKVCNGKCGPAPPSGSFCYPDCPFGRKPTLADQWALFNRSLRQYQRKRKITPSLRERCVRYALDAKCGQTASPYQINQDAASIAKYIAEGKENDW